MTEIQELIRCRIQSRLDDIGKSVSKAPVDAGLSRSAIRDILSGKSASPSVDTLVAIARSLDCSVSYLIGEGVLDQPGTLPQKDVAERLSAMEAIIAEMRSSLNIKTGTKSVSLKEWLKKNGITQSDFAEAVGIHFVHMNKFVNRKKRPGVNLIERIEKATGGEVNFESWREVSP